MQVIIGKGFGHEKFNGFGGKVNVQEETIEQAAQRELQEEAGITAINPDKVAIITFEFDPKYEEKILEGLQLLYCCLTVFSSCL